LVNSFHHQAVKTLAPEFIETAKAADGINEAMEHQEKEIFSVQWHPEAMATNDDEQMLKLFKQEVEAARLFRKAKCIHHHHISIDSHTDTPMIFPGEFNIGQKEGGKVNLPFMEEGLIDAVIMAAYIPQGPRDEAALQQATAFAVNRLNEIHRQGKINNERMGIARTPQEIQSLKNIGKKAILLGVENGYAIGKDLDNIKRFKDLDVVYITLCHNGDNDICDSARGHAEWNGLSPFGKEVIKKMNEEGLMVDLSHAAESTFYDALENSQYPIIASHSAARALCNHPRNLTDDQLKALAAKGGVVQLCLYKGFINEDSEKASLSDAIRHIEHIVDLIGIDYVGIGSDFDGDGELIGCRSTNELINITTRLLKEGFNENEIAKIWGGNLLRVMSIVQEASSYK
jgi:microsomal dipeptidase-like Zn-dependent dipeptidase